MSKNRQIKISDKQWQRLQEIEADISNKYQELGGINQVEKKDCLEEYENLLKARLAIIYEITFGETHD